MLQSSHVILFSLKPLDIEFMKQLHHLVNIIPVIAKSDTLTAPELKKLKQRVMQEIRDNGIQVCMYIYNMYCDLFTIGVYW